MKEEPRCSKCCIPLETFQESEVCIYCDPNQKSNSTEKKQLQGGKTNMEEQTQQVDNWLENEAQELNQQTSFDGEKLPALQFEENKIVKFTVDFSEKFHEYHDDANKCVKAIIPVSHNGDKKILWLNKKNPLYKDLVLGGKDGKTEFSVIQVGNKANTKYNLVEN